MRFPSVRPEFRRWKMSDGYELQGRLWVPPGGAAQSVILYLHGIQSHGGWFEWSASVLAESGQPVMLVDRRGSGLNSAARGDTPSAQRWLDDQDELADWAACELGSRQISVVGVSWGGKLAVAWALRRPERVARLLLIAPGLFPAVDVGLAGRLRIGLGLCLRPVWMLPIPLADPALFTDNPAGRAFICDDPLKLTRATARFFFHSARLDRGLLSAAGGALLSDTWLLLAGRDRIIRNAPTVRWLEHVAARPVTVHNFAQAAHTLEFEPDTAELRRLLIRWSQS